MSSRKNDRQAYKTFWELKTFPRTKHNAVDDGSKRKPMRQKYLCPVCLKIMFETVSLEFCNECGYVETDFWYDLDKKNPY